MKLLLVILLSLICCTGCSLFKSACDSAMPTIQTAQSYEADAIEKLEQVRAMVAYLPVDSAKRAELVKALSAAEQALSGVASALAGASGACRGVDALSVFADFLKAWEKLEPLVLGVVSLFAASPGAPSIPTPAVVLRARGL